MKHTRAIGALTIAATLVVTACGDGGSTASGGAPTELPRVVEITMTDNAYSVTELAAKKGDEVTFRFRNNGSVDHEALLGTAQEQQDHEAEMNGPAGTGGGMDGMGDMEGMDHGQGSGEALTVAPGETADLVHRFESSGELIIGCHVPGHYEAGMQATVNVA